MVEKLTLCLKKTDVQMQEVQLKKKKRYLQHTLRYFCLVVILLKSIKSAKSLRLELTHWEKTLPSNSRQATLQFL